MKTSNKLSALFALSAMSIGSQTQANPAPATAAPVDFAKVQSILETKCLECHNPKKVKGELLMDTAENLKKGGDSGASVVAGKPDESELVKRQDKWIRHQRLSRASAAMKTTLYNLIHHSDPALGLRNIQEMNDGVPFAEMEDDLEALKTPHQVSWYKRMLNVVHYLNNSFTYLESLDYELINKDDTRNFLKGSLVEGIYHLKPYIELTKACQTFMDLMQEPVGQKVYDALKRNFDDLLSYWNQIGPLYAVESGEIIVQNPKNIERGGVWYPLLSLFVAPEHFQALSDNKNYGQHEALLAQKNAKEIAQYIEFLTDKTLSGEYFSLFLRSPRPICCSRFSCRDVLLLL